MLPELHEVFHCYWVSELHARGMLMSSQTEFLTPATVSAGRYADYSAGGKSEADSTRAPLAGRVAKMVAMFLVACS